MFCHGIFAEEEIYTETKCTFSERDRSKLDDFYKQIYVYERDDFLASCDDTLNTQLREIDPRGCGILDESHSIYFDSSTVDKLVQKKETIRITTRDDGIKKTMKRIYCENFYERIVTIHDKKDSLLFSKHYKWNGQMLIQTIDDGVVRNIIPGRTPCYFTIVEPSGDSIYFNLDPKKKISGSIKNKDNFFYFIHGYNILYQNFDILYKRYYKEYGKHDAIIYHWHSFCKSDPNFEILYETHDSLDLENEFNVSVKENEDFSVPPYKYYAIIVIFIVTASIIIIRKKRKGNEK
jgi:hypothetical protein